MYQKETRKSSRPYCGDRMCSVLAGCIGWVWCFWGVAVRWQLGFIALAVRVPGVSFGFQALAVRVPGVSS